MKLLSEYRVTFLSVCLFALLQPARADGPVVTHVSVGARPANYVGKCPAHVRFIGTIVVSRSPVVVEYQWERSDGAQSAPQRIEVRGKGRGVTEDWELGAPHAPQQVWERLHVLAPNGMTSAPARVRVACHQ